MDPDDTNNRISRLKELATEFFPMEHGQLIERYLEKLRVIDIVGTTYDPHPHVHHRVFISRKALKHFVESRKVELLKRHSIEEACAIICGALEEIPFVFEEFSVYRL